MYEESQWCTWNIFTRGGVWDVSMREGDVVLKYLYFCGTKQNE